MYLLLVENVAILGELEWSKNIRIVPQNTVIPTVSFRATYDFYLQCYHYNGLT